MTGRNKIAVYSNFNLNKKTITDYQDYKKLPWNRIL